jgi:hypothetical protein
MNVKKSSLSIASLRCLFLMMLFLQLFSFPAFSDVFEDMNLLWKDVYDQGITIADGLQPTLPVEVLAKARSDECFNEIFIPDPENPDIPPENPNIYDPGQSAACDFNKVNQAYVWGMTKSGDNIWFGTGSNVQCLVSASYLGVSDEAQNEAWVCEFGYSRYLKDLFNTLPDLFSDNYDLSGIPLELFGDWRPPRIFVYNIRTKILTDKTPPYSILFPQYPETLSNATIGIRSAGTLGQIILLGGPSALGGIDLYAYRADTGTYLGSSNINNLPGGNIMSVNNIRKWLVVEGVLYTSVGVTYADGINSGGKVLRWRGSLLNPFNFEVVGTLDSAGAELATHNGRLFVSTWSGEGEIGLPLENQNQSPAGIYMSPVIPSGGLTSAHAAEGIWQKVWTVNDYEPDPVIAATYGVGALASFDGYLFWGTMHVPSLSYAAQYYYIIERAGKRSNVYFADAGPWESYYPKSNTAYKEKRDALWIRSTLRAITIFRGKNFTQPDQQIDLLYGQKAMPRFTLTQDAVKGFVGTYDMAENNMGGAEPLFGPMGFGNVYNNYTWTMDVLNNRLYLGTMNSTILAYRGEVPDDENLAVSMGANLFSFSSADLPAVPERIDGAGNYANYGIRTMLADGDSLYLGTANPMNLLTNENGENIGGWELVKLGNWTTSSKGTGRIYLEITDPAAGEPFMDHIGSLRDDDPDINQAGKPTDQSFPDGLVAFSIKNLKNQGDTVRVKITLPGNYPAGSKYYKTTENGFEEFLNPDGSKRYIFNGNNVTLELKDGDRWDKDGLTNGEIVDPGGPGMIKSPASGGGGGGGCFIGSLLK